MKRLAKVGSGRPSVSSVTVSETERIGVRGIVGSWRPRLQGGLGTEGTLLRSPYDSDWNCDCSGVQQRESIPFWSKILLEGRESSYLCHLNKERVQLGLVHELPNGEYTIKHLAPGFEEDQPPDR